MGTALTRRTTWQNTACIGCACLGGALLIWGAMSAFVSPSLVAQAGTLIVFPVGAGFLWLWRQIRARPTWALWVASGISSVIFAVAAACAFIFQSHFGNSYLVLMSLATASAAALALEEQRRNRTAPLAAA